MSVFKDLYHFLQQAWPGALREEVKRRQAAQAEVLHLKARLEEKQREHRRLTEVQRIVHLGHWEWDVVSNVLDWSDEIYRIFGLTPQAFGATYEAFLRAVHPDDRQLVDSRVREARELGHPYSLDHRILLPDGTLRHVHEQAQLSCDATGQVIKMMGTVQDITEAKQMELSLLESEERFRKAFQYSAIGMALVGLDGHWLKVNKSLCQMLGYSEQEFLGKTFQDITHPDDLQSSREYLKQLLTGKLDHFQMEKRYLHRDGHIVWISLSVSLILDAQRKPIQFVTQVEDITGNKLALQAMHKANWELSLFRKLLDNSSDAIEVIDPATGRFLDVNETTCRDLGYSREELLSMGVSDIDSSFNDALRKTIVEQMGRSGTVRIESMHRRKDGSTFAVEVSAVAANLDKPYWLSIVRDITERKLAEEKIRQLNEELETRVRERTQQLLAAQEELVRKEKLALLGQVAGSMGHELRNPLGVMSNAVFFLQTVLSDADDSVKEYLKIIKDEIAGSERIVADLLDAVRTKSPIAQTTGIAELIGQTLRQYIVPASVTVTLDIPATLPALKVDALQIQQVLRNLIRNGVEAMPQGGALDISAKENRPDGTVTVAVRDSGIGMTPDQLGKLFQPLFSTKARGIGLGLVVVKNLTEANGGSVRVHSEVGKGSTFAVTLPCGTRECGHAK